MNIPDFPLTLELREDEVARASDIASAHARVRLCLKTLQKDGCYCVYPHDNPVLLDGPADVERAFQIYLALRPEKQREIQTQFLGHLSYLSGAA